MQLGATRARDVLSALWHVRKEKFNAELLKAATLGLNSADRDEMLLCIRWVPGWLGDKLVKPRFPAKLLANAESVEKCAGRDGAINYDYPHNDKSTRHKGHGTR